MTTTGPSRRKLDFPMSHPLLAPPSLVVPAGGLLVTLAHQSVEVTLRNMSYKSLLVVPAHGLEPGRPWGQQIQVRCVCQFRHADSRGGASCSAGHDRKQRACRQAPRPTPCCAHDPAGAGDPFASRAGPFRPARLRTMVRGTGLGACGRIASCSAESTMPPPRISSRHRRRGRARPGGGIPACPGVSHQNLHRGREPTVSRRIPPCPGESRLRPFAAAPPSRGPTREFRRISRKAGT